MLLYINISCPHIFHLYSTKPDNKILNIRQKSQKSKKNHKLIKSLINRIDRKKYNTSLH